MSGTTCTTDGSPSRTGFAVTTTAGLVLVVVAAVGVSAVQTDVAGAANDDCDGLVERAEAAADRVDAAWSMLPPRSQRQRQDTWWDDAYDDALGVVASATDELAFLVLEAPDCFSPEQRAGARQLQSEVGRLVDRR